MDKKIIKADIVDDLYEMCKKEMGKDEVSRIVDRVILKMRKELENGNFIELRGFGSFKLKKRAGNLRARNPKTGEIVQVSPHYAITFKPGIELKKAMREIKTNL